MKHAFVEAEYGVVLEGVAQIASHYAFLKFYALELKILSTVRSQ
jgi:hypothetical protein